MEPDDAPRWTDCHNHVQLLPVADWDVVLAAMSQAGVVRCVVNATREEEWRAVEELAVAWPERVVPAFGIHPWYAADVAAGWEDRLRSLLERHPRAGVGECGLDGLAAVEQAAQRRVFEAQLGIAGELGRVLTIHCVGGWNGLFEPHTKEPPPPRFLMHGYSGSVETALRL
ncbi:MAG: TatD family hydrolase, partial [Akkermansiaceae bacterium]|nr:TatD family hydrolase [Akkermansiaceae bacterium]